MLQSQVQRTIHDAQMEIKRKKILGLNKTALWMLVFPMARKKLAKAPITEVDSATEKIVASLMRNKETEYTFPLNLQQEFTYKMTPDESNYKRLYVDIIQQKNVAQELVEHLANMYDRPDHWQN